MLKYYKSCADSKIVAQPTFARVEDQTFALSDFRLSSGHAKALETYFTESDEAVIEVLLDRNGLKDESMASILRGFTKQEIQKLTISNNELGQESLIILNTQIAKHLRELKLGNVKLSR